MATARKLACLFWCLLTREKDGTTRAIGPDRVVTNRHVIENAYKAEVHSFSGARLWMSSNFFCTPTPTM